MDSPETVELDSMKKKPETKDCSSYKIDQILDEFEVNSWYQNLKQLYQMVRKKIVKRRVKQRYLATQSLTC